MAVDHNNDDTHEWFDRPRSGEREPGLRFACTMCGNCCTGPAGYVLVSDEEIAGLARRFGMTPAQFEATYTHMTRAGRSLTEVKGPGGWDCVFLDRTSRPGKAICSAYEARPRQCRTWPFWSDNVATEDAWLRASRTCPGIDHGPLHVPSVIRMTRDGRDV